MTKAELINAMAEQAGTSKAAAKRFLDAFTDSVTGALKTGDKVTLVGFGTFSVSERKARKGRNPATGDTIDIPAKTVLKARIVKQLKDSVLPKT